MRSALLAVFLVGYIGCYAQPDWLNPASLEDLYPNKSYLVGYSSLEKSEGPVLIALDDVIDFAILNLGESLFLEVVSASDETASEYFLPNSISRQVLYDGGMKVETHYDSINEIAYAMAYLKKKAIDQAGLH